MNIRPLGNRILVKRIESEEKKTVGGIFLPDSARNEKVVCSEVLAVGTAEKIEVKKGDEIIVSSYAVTEFEVDEDKLLLVKAPDVLAVIKKK